MVPGPTMVPGPGTAYEAGTIAAKRYARAHRRTTLRRLAALIADPTVSADRRRSTDLRRCARRLARLASTIGLRNVEVHDGLVAPVVTACRRGPPRAPSVLVYGHYDVQPAEPLAAWRSDPFTMTVRGRHVHGRGASDDKGQLMCHLAAIEAWLRGAGRLPVTVRLVLDGEEEIGSPTLLAAIGRGDPRLDADLLVVADTRMLAPGVPVLVSGLRGVYNARLDVTGPSTDVHSGAFGGAVVDPAQELARLVAGLCGPGGRVATPGFYAKVRGPGAGERDRLARFGPKDADFLAPTGVTAGGGETGFTAYERATVRPALVVTDLHTSGAGRSVVPARATARLNVRLVPGQRPAEIGRLLRRHLLGQARRGVRAALTPLGGCPPYRLRPTAPVVEAVQRACERVYGRPALLLPSGGTIPFVNSIAEARGMDAVLLGFGLPDDAIHGPNERMSLPGLFQGTEACIEFYAAAGTETIRGGRPPSHVCSS